MVCNVHIVSKAPMLILSKTCQLSFSEVLIEIELYEFFLGTIELYECVCFLWASVQCLKKQCTIAATGCLCLVCVGRNMHGLAVCVVGHYVGSWFKRFSLGKVYFTSTSLKLKCLIFHLKLLEKIIFPCWAVLSLDLFNIELVCKIHSICIYF